MLHRQHFYDVEYSWMNPMQMNNIAVASTPRE